MDLELPVTLVVKAPNQKVDDQTIECGLGWTIKKLKEHISKVYPSKPREHQQKLIYSGRLLYDHLTLKDVLRQYDDDIGTHTVHLVCAPTAAETARQDNAALSSGSSTSSSRGESPSSSPPASPPPVAEGLRQRRPGPAESAPGPEAVPLPTTTAATTPQPAPDAFQNMYGANMMYGANFYQGGVPGMMAYSPEQMMWLQQMYAQQMAQYMQLYQGQGAMPPTPPATPAPVQPQQDAAVNQNAPAGNAAVNQRAAGGDQPIRMNAQGGMVMDDDDENMNRDWLDWMYTLSRVAVLLSIVYFYSTFGRFMLVLGLFIGAYLYQGGWFRIQRRGQRDQPQRQDQQQAQQQQAQQQQEQRQQQAEQHGPDAQPNQDQTSDEEDSTGAEDGPAAEPAEPPPPGRLAVAWSFFYTFFSSLVPQQPPAVNAN